MQMDTSKPFNSIPFEEFKVAILAKVLPPLTIYPINLRRLWRTGKTVDAAFEDAQRLHMLDIPVEPSAPIGRPRTVGVRRGRYLKHKTVMRRLADATHYACCKLLRHRLGEDDLKMVRGLKAQCEQTVFWANNPDDESDEGED